MMEYLKLSNHPIRGLFPEISGSIDWVTVGIDPIIASRLSVQGYDSIDNSNHITLIPIASREKILASGVIGTVNGNENINDKAEVIGQESFDNLKAIIEDIRQQSL